MESPREQKPNTELRRGWTTGACATAATKAALTALITGEFPDPVEITLPKGETPSFALCFESLNNGGAFAGIVKDAGDDPDVTHGATIIAHVVGELCAEHMLPPDLKITISVPGGEDLAKQTWNPRLGIVGGISILGTTGIVHPFSCSAWIHSIHRGIDVARAADFQRVIGATGSTSEDVAQQLYQLPETALLDMGDFAGGLLKYLRKHPVPNLTIAGGFAKLTKLAQGALDLHSGRSQVDFQWLAKQIEALADEPLNQKLKNQILNANTAAEVLELTQDLPIDLPTQVARLAQKSAQGVLRDAPVHVEIIVVSRSGEILARV